MKQETKQELDVKAIQERLEKVGTMYYEDVHFLQESIPALLSALSDAEGIVREMTEVLGAYAASGSWEWDGDGWKWSGMHGKYDYRVSPSKEASEILDRPEVQSILSRGGK